MKVITVGRQEEKVKEAAPMAVRVISRGLSMSNAANVYSCCRKGQRQGQVGGGI